MKKRGQITLFIILGIILLSAISLVLYIRSTTVEEGLSPDLVPSISQVPVEARPIRQYTEECISRLSEEAFRKIGFGGGYIDHDDYGILASSTLPTESDGVRYPGSDLKVPYWWYLKSSNDCAGNCVFTTMQPPLEALTGAESDRSVETQVEEYVDSNIRQCLADYAPFREQGFSFEETGGPETVTIVGDLGVDVFLRYPLEVSKGETTHSFELFYVSVPLEFKKVYNFADEIRDAQMNYTFLERHVLNMISSLASLDSQGLPPLTESTFEFGQGEIWSSAEVKERLESLIMTYIPGLQVFDTAGYERQAFPADDIRQALYDQMVIPLNIDGEYSGLYSSFDYLNVWPIYFDAGEGGVIRPESVMSSYLVLGWQRYNTAYDLSFPVVATIRDPDAFNGKGYTFMFALEGNIRNNEPIDQDFAGLEGTHLLQDSLLCNLNQRNSGDIKLTVKDASTGQGLEDVEITYTCGAESCAIGGTDEEGKLTARFPVCHNGIISFFKQDYFTSSEYLSTSLDRKDSLYNIQMYPYAEKDVEVMKWNYNPAQNSLSSSPVDLAAEEEAIVRVTRIREGPGEIEVSAVAEVSGESDRFSRLRLVPGTYEVNIMTILHEEVLIPEDEREVETGLIGSLVGADEDYTIPEVRFEDNYPSGGAVLNSNTGYLTIGNEELYSDNRIRFYAISPPLPEKIEDLERISKSEEYSARFRQSIEPGFVR